MITLDEAAGGKTIITPELITKVSEVYRDELLDFTGGAMFVIRDLSPAVSEADLDGRIQAEREGPHFTQLRYNRSKVIGLEAVEGTDAFSSFAVLAHNPNVDFTGRAKELQTFVDNEADLLDKALQRAGSLGSATVFDSTFAGQAGQAAIAAFVLSWLAIVAYLWIRFGSARWGLAAVVCLVHDVVIALGMVAISGFIYNTVIGRMLAIEAFKIDMAMVAAFLTIIGYSVNDTIVVFDRIRENRGRLTTVDERTINRSINQTISRTLLTTTTTLIAVVVMYTMGGAGIHAFTFALLVGIIFGTYSSIAVASPLLLGFKHAVVGKAMTGPEAVADK